MQTSIFSKNVQMDSVRTQMKNSIGFKMTEDCEKKVPIDK